MQWLLLLAIIPTILALIVAAAVLYQREREAVDAQLELGAQSATKAFDKSILGTRQVLETFAVSIASRDRFELREIELEAQKIQKETGQADAISMFDSDGRILFNTYQQIPPGITRTHNWDSVKQVLESRHAEVSNLYTGTVTQRRQISVNVPVFKNGEIVYVLSGAIFLEHLNAMLEAQNFPPEWGAAIADSQNTLIARRRNAEKYIGLKAANPLQDIASDTRGIKEMTTIEGVQAMVVVKRSELAPFTVAVTIPVSSFHASLNRQFEVIALMMVFVIGGSLLFMALILRNFKASLKQLSNAALALSHKDFEVVLPSFGAKEIQKLSTQFELMREAVHASESNILKEQQRLTEILENLPASVALLNADHTIAFANKQYRDRFGDARDRPGSLAQFNRTSPCENCGTFQVLESKGQHEWEWTGPDGRNYAVYAQHIQNTNGSPLILELSMDITERKQAALEKERLNRALSLVRECDLSLVKSQTEEALLHDVCRTIVESGGYQMAWIGLAEHDSQRSVRAVAQSGYEEGYLSAIRVSWKDGELGLGPTSAAIRTSSTQINQNCQTNPKMAPWREAALQQGYQASIALPLMKERRAFGALTIYSVDANAFNGEAVALLEQLAADLSFGILSKRSERAHQEALEAQRTSEARYRLILDNAADAVFIVNVHRQFVYVNQQAVELLDYGRDALLSMGVGDITPPSRDDMVGQLFEQLNNLGRLRIEIDVIARTGTVIPIELNAVRLPDGNCFAACRDITERKQYERELAHSATHDPLTGLANRSLLMDRLNQALQHAKRSGHLVAVMLLDIDRFKMVNDSLTHSVGDALLIEISNRLLHLFRGLDTVARFGGDEFMIVMSDLTGEDDLAKLTERVLQAVAQPIRVEAHDLVVTASLGIAVYPRDADNAQALIKNADIAMYRAKDAGRNGFQFYSPEMNARLLDRLELERDLRQALLDEQLVLHYQPKVDIRSGAIVGAEALIRWRHPRSGMVSPAEFIPLAEETGLIVPIGQWALETACRQVKAWHLAGFERMTVAVNISVRQFEQADLGSTVTQALSAAQLAPQYLELEVTETAVMTRPEKATEILEQLRRLGVRISLDDFGTGYSSLNYLKHFPIHSLKIDQAFVRDITTDADDAAIARLVIALGHEMGHKVIAEGVETEAQLNFLRKHRCDEMQGFLFSRPVAADAFTALLQTQISAQSLSI
ncbi:MAG: EAL domain-containing protein [Burkholderiaceae bacterium]|nr:EAL domain-containing protein [Burkholderiaceae bacterium]